MEQLVTRIGNAPAVPTEIDLDFAFDLDQKTFDGLQRIFNQLCDLTDIIGKDYDLSRLRELVQADREGRCVVLPCKRYDTLWTFCDYPKSKVYSFKVTDVSTLNGRTMLNTDVLSVVDARDIGKTVFLTREAAEAALKEREKDESR